MTGEKKRKWKFGSTAANIILVLIIVVAVNVIAAGLYFRWDITEEHLYTLSDGTKKIVNNIKTSSGLKPLPTGRRSV